MRYSEYPVRLADFSRFQDDPSTAYKPTLEKIKAAGFMGVGIQIGFGIVEDRMFRHFWKSAKENGLERLPYFYGDYYSHRGTGMTDTEWGIEQAQNAWDLMKDDPGEIPLYLDIEPSNYGGKFTEDNIGKITTIFRAFLTEYDRLSGGKAGIYCSPGYLWIFGDWFKDRPIWLAWYRDDLTMEKVQAKLVYYKWRNVARILQYTSDGDVDDNGTADGIELGLETDNIDLNIFLGNMEEWSKFCGNTPVPADNPITIEDDVTVPITGIELSSLELRTVTYGSGTNVRNLPTTSGSVILGWLAKGEKMYVLQRKVINGGESWIMYQHGKWIAERYNNIQRVE